MLVWTLLQALSFAPPLPGDCDGYDDVERPSSFDLVLLAEVIVVVEAQNSLTRPRRGDEFDIYSVPNGMASLRTVSLLKGQAPAQFEIPVGFYTGGPTGGNLGAECEPWEPRQGLQYMLFLTPLPQGNFRILTVPASPVAVRYGGPNSFWVRLIKMYAAMQQTQQPDIWLPELDRMLRQRLRADAQPEEQWQARQFMDHLRSTSPDMPTTHLLALHQLLEQGRLPVWGLRSGISASTDFDNQPWPDFIHGRPPPRYPRDAEQGRRDVRLALITGHHPSAASFFQKLTAKGRHPDEMADAKRFLASQGVRPIGPHPIERE